MYIPLKITTDYSLLSSLIKIDNLISFLKKNNIDTCAICDTNLYGVMDFYNNAITNGIKPIIGLEIDIDSKPIYLYAKDYEGYQNLLKLNTINNNSGIKIFNLKEYCNNILSIIPYKSRDIYEIIKEIFEDVYLGYTTDTEKKNISLLTDKVVFIPDIKALTKEDTNYIKYLEIIKNGECKNNYDNNYFILNNNKFDIKTTEDVASKLNLVIPKNNRYIPKYLNNNINSFEFLYTLAKKGLTKRLNGNINDKYMDRLKYELSVINKMGFIDYFLIVYDYVLFAKKSNILVGVGRGSAAGSLVSYSLGITDIDPLKYDLLFERFLNPERVTMPDIDIDFEYTKRHLVIEYVKNKYGINNVAGIMTYSTLTSKQVIRDVGKILNISSDILNKFLNNINAKESLQVNMQHEVIKKFITNYKEIQKLYKICLKLENIKRQVSTHAAGVVISSVELDTVIPTYNNNGELLTGVTMNYLEDLGLLKMDFLSIKNLTTIQNLLNLIGEEIKLNNIPLDDKRTYELFSSADTDGIFQFESNGMKNFLQKLKPSCFEDLVAALALFRPGPMNNIDTYIKRKEGREKVTYLHPLLEPILKETYGIIVYQEQIMLILVSLADYSFAEADNIRRAMSKKKKDVMEREEKYFIAKSFNKGISKDIAKKIYDMILKFADYGFNKSHSVGYALIGYQMAYLKTHYNILFMINLLNMNIGSEIKIKEYLADAKRKGLNIKLPNINISGLEFSINNDSILLPLPLIKNFGNQTIITILNDIKNNGKYSDYLNFVSRSFINKLTKKNLETLIFSGALDNLEFNRKTMIENLDVALNYGSLVADLAEEYVMKPEIAEYEEYSNDELRNQELNSFGFFISNHPSSKYIDNDIVKFSTIDKYFNKRIKAVVLIENIKVIKTKNNEEMAFITGSDETGIMDLVAFPKVYNNMKDYKLNDLVLINGKVEKRFDKYQIMISTINKM